MTAGPPSPAPPRVALPDGRTVPWLSRLDEVPRRAGAADDRTGSDGALRRLRAGELLRYGGDFQNARQLLAALGRRLAPRPRRSLPLPQAFHRERERRRQAQAVLSRLAVPVGPGWRVPLRRAPEVAEALAEALGPPPEEEGLLPLRELLGAVGAHEWRRRGVEVPALQARIHPHHGVFAPVRGEYVGLVADALEGRDLAGRIAFDVGTGAGVLALLLARRGARVVASDAEEGARACAADNAARLGLADRLEVVAGDPFPPGRADLVICNPPWIPAEPHGPLDRAVYDPGSRFLLAFLAGLARHLAPGGEGMLVLSDLAERLGLRPPGFLDEALERSGLRRTWQRSAPASHPRSQDRGDPLHAARAAEVVSVHGLRPR